MFSSSPSDSAGTAFGIVGTLLFLIIIVGVLGLGRKRRRDPVTLAMGIAWYAQMAIAVSATLALSGAAILVKVIVGLVHPASSYPTFDSSPFPSYISDFPSPAPIVDQVGRMREQDFIMAIILIAVGSALVWLHVRSGKQVRGVLDGPAAWIAWGTPIVTVAFYSLLGLGAGIATTYQLITNIVMDPSSHGETPAVFGEGLGIALAFIGGWALMYWQLFAAVRNDNGDATAAPPSPPAA